MSVFLHFCDMLRTIVRTHAGVEINISMPTSAPGVNGHIRFYSRHNLRPALGFFTNRLGVIDRCCQDGDYVLIWLKMGRWTALVIPEIINVGSLFGYHMLSLNRDNEISVITDECDNSVTSLRISLLKDAFQKLAICNGFKIGSNGLKFLLSKKNNSNCANLVLCSNVVPNITAEAYKQQKHDDISKMSADRTDESIDYPIDIISKLCHTSIVYELLSVKHNKVIHVKNETSNKDKGIFIMYNYSRLCQVLAVYEKKILENHFSTLSNINDINFNLLQTTEEWTLILHYLSVYPSLIQECAKYLSSTHVGVHKLCSFLAEMSSSVSSFYHKHNVLMDPIPNFLQLMEARLYLVKALIQVYENVFQILGIEAVSEI